MTGRDLRPRFPYEDTTRVHVFAGPGGRLPAGLELERGVGMPGIRVKDNESFESALRRFKKKCEKAGVLADLRRHQHFEKPSERRKRKLNAAKRKNLARKVEN